MGHAIMEPQAFHGPLGAYVRTIEPHTEADPHAILVQLHVLMGNVMGRHAYFRHENDVHYTNMFAVIVGPTAKGRKGVALGQALRLLVAIDPGWKRSRVVSGLSSGEGVIFHVRDATDGDLGVDDKRLMVTETEFASVLKVMKREGNNLSPTLRQAWDSATLRVLTRNNPLSAQGAHVSITGHVTVEEVQRHLTETEMANGFANRFLWVVARRSKLLPEGGRADRIDWAPLLQQFQEAMRFASKAGEIRRDVCIRPSQGCRHDSGQDFDTRDWLRRRRELRLLRRVMRPTVLAGVRRGDLRASHRPVFRECR